MLQRSLDRGRQHGSERDAEKVERGRERLRVEVPDRDEPLLVQHDEWVALVRVQLDRELLLDEAERIACGSVHLRHAAEGERVLEEARGAGFPKRAAVEQIVHPRERLADPRVRAGGRDLEVQRADVRAERLEVECRGEVDPVEQ